MAGSVTANPNSAMTVFTNPAGMTAVGRRLDVSADIYSTRLRLDARSNFLTGFFGGPGGDVTRRDMAGVPSFAFIAPTSNPDLTFGLGFGVTAASAVDYGSVAYATGRNFNGFADLALYRLAPAVSYKVDPRLTVGAAVHLNMGQFGFRSTFDSMTVINFGRGSRTFGLGLGLGLLYELDPGRWTIGLSYSTAANLARFRYHQNGGDITGMIDERGSAVTAPAGEYKVAADFPQQAALGLALRPRTDLILSSDIKWIDYSSVLTDFKITGAGREWNLRPRWKDVWAWSLGATWFYNKEFTFMAGYDYANAPVRPETLFNNLIFPTIGRHHITGGVRYKFYDGWDVTGTIMHVPRERITGSGDLNAGLWGTNNSKMTIEYGWTSFGLNLGYKF